MGAYHSDGKKGEGIACFAFKLHRREEECGGLHERGLLGDRIESGLFHASHDKKMVLRGFALRLSIREKNDVRHITNRGWPMILPRPVMSPKPSGIPYLSCEAVDRSICHRHMPGTRRKGV